MYYPFPEQIPLWQPLTAFALLFIVSIYAFGNLKQKPYLAVGWLWYLGTLVPVIGLVQVGLAVLAGTGIGPHGGEGLMARGAKDVRLVVIVAAPDGVELMSRRTPGTNIYTAALDRVPLQPADLDRGQGVVPRLGPVGFAGDHGALDAPDHDRPQGEHRDDEGHAQDDHVDPSPTSPGP